ncbi:MAG: calcium-binding protein [Xenococcus sp. (in: cyanobacteria)]
MMSNNFSTFRVNVIRGTNQDDIIRGILGENNAIFGLAGNDTIFGGQTVPGRKTANLLYGGKGNDQMFGGRGNDTLVGGDGNDFLQSGKGNDLLFGDKGNDVFFGQEGNDTLFGGDGDDFLRGQGRNEFPDGNDYIVGGRGNDRLIGDRGNDILVGVDDSIGVSNAGLGEIDVLTGDQDQDRFVLGDRDEVFYNDNNPNSSGVQDYARITDFQTNIDTIQLKGSASDYVLDNSFTLNGRSGTGIFLNEENQELIGFAQGVNNLNINSGDFLFVS